MDDTTSWAPGPEDSTHTDKAPNLLCVATDGGKYTLVQEASGRMYVLKYGKPWPAGDLLVTGCNLILTVFQDLENARTLIASLNSVSLSLEAKYKEVQTKLEESERIRHGLYEELTQAKNGIGNLEGSYERQVDKLTAENRRLGRDLEKAHIELKSANREDVGNFMDSAAADKIKDMAKRIVELETQLNQANGIIRARDNAVNKLLDQLESANVDARPPVININFYTTKED